MEWDDFRKRGGREYKVRGWECLRSDLPDVENFETVLDLLREIFHILPILRGE